MSPDEKIYCEIILKIIIKSFELYLLPLSFSSILTMSQRLFFENENILLCAPSIAKVASFERPSS